jgi:hypothetical protein
LQRFISEDPAGFAAGDTNLYAYVGNNPTNLTDPSGENPAAGAVATCLTNAAISGGLSVLEQRLAGRKVNWGWGGVGGAAAIGCVGGLAAEALGWIVGRAIGRAFGGGADDLLSNGCRANSFTADTPVLLADGTTKPISEVEVGDWVLASDPESGQATPQRVKDVIVGEGQKRLVDVKVDGKILTATEGHPFYSVTEHRWVPAGDLAPGDRLRRADGHKAVINSVREYGVAKARVFNLTVEGVHTFFAGKTKILVHNCAWSWHDGPRDYLVYLGLGDGSPLYVGKTSRIMFRDRRWAHLRDPAKPLLDDVRPFIENLTETEALVVETRLFERFRGFLEYNDRRSLRLSAEQRQWADDFLQRTFGI